MKKRVKSFIMAILMLFTILPTNFTTVEADLEDLEINIYILDKNKDAINTEKVTIEAYDNKNNRIDTVKYEIKKDPRGNLYNAEIKGFSLEDYYTLIIKCEGYLIYENIFKATTDKEYNDVTLLKDPFSSYDFKNLPDTMEMSAEETSIQTNIKPEEMDGFVQEFYSDNTDVATIDKSTGKILKISKPGKVTFRARLVNEEAHSYKEISKPVTMEKISHSLIPVEGKEPKDKIYTKQDGSALYKSSDDSYNGEITYSIDKADGADLAYTDENFEKNGKWKAKGTYGTVKVHVAAPETDRYKGIDDFYYTTSIIPADYNNYSAYWDIAGTKYKDTDIYTDFSGIVPKADSADGNTYVIKLQGDDDSMWSKDGIAADRLSLIQGTNNIPVSIGKGVFEGDEIKDVVETGETTISFNYDSEAPQVSEFDFSAGCRPNENGWNNGDITVNIAAKDTGSDVGAIKYQLTGADGKVLVDKSDISFETNNGLASGSIKIPYNYQGDNLVLKAWVYDNTGHECQTKELKIKNDSVINEPAVNLNSKIRFFNRNVDVNISAGDDLSGIASVKYVVLQDGDTLDWSKGEDIFNGKAGDKSFEKSITIDKGIGFAKKLNVYVMVTDMAGNVKSACLNDDEKFTIDITAPNVGVRFCDKDDDKSDSAPVTRAGTIDYYNKAKTAVITVDDRNFDADSVKIMVKSDDGKEADIAKKKDAVEGVTIGDWNNNSINVNFACGHTYSLYVIATDKAGNSNTVSDIKVSGDRSLSFLLDNEIPSGNFSLIGYRDGSKKTDFGNWADRVLNRGELSYNVYSNMVTYMEGNVCDSLSRVKYAGYIYSDAVLSDTQLMSADLKWNELELGGDYEFKNQIPAVDRKFIIYVKITDNCDNTRYISSDGVVYDETIPVVENVSISDETKPNDDSWNRKDVNINVSASDCLLYTSPSPRDRG